MPPPATSKSVAGAPARETSALAAPDPNSAPASLAPQDIRWPAAPAHLKIAPDELHLWLLHSPDFANQLPHLQTFLSAHELARAASFHFPKDRDAYIIRHGILRLILSRYLQQPPAEIEFHYSARGKPEIKTTTSPLHFNDSHSADFVLYGVAAACPIGVDIEKARPIPEFEEIAANYFSPREVAMMRALTPELRMQAFYTAWTRKEAFLKATGEGIGENLAKVEVTLAPNDQPEILAVPGDPQARSEWKLKAFSPAPGYLAAAAFRHQDLTLCEWSVPILTG
jgi:4'-phosphopantetheinyl transferase